MLTQSSSIGSYTTTTSNSQCETILQQQLSCESNRSDDIVADRRSGDYTETKKFWESLDSQRDDTHSSSGTAPPPVPKPRSQVSSLGSSLLRTEESLENSSVRELSQDSSSRISSERQVEYSESSSMVTGSKHELARDDDSIIAEDRLEDESFPINEKFDSDGDHRTRDQEFRLESLDYDNDKSDASIYKVKEREDILDDEEDAPNASFYIGESSGNIITKTSAEKRADYLQSEESTQDVCQEIELETVDLQNVCESSPGILRRSPSGLNLHAEAELSEPSRVSDNRTETKSDRSANIEQCSELNISKAKVVHFPEDTDKMLQEISESKDASIDEFLIAKPSKVVHSPIDSWKERFTDDELVKHEEFEGEPEEKAPKEKTQLKQERHDNFYGSKAQKTEAFADVDFLETKASTAKVVHSPVDSYRTIVEVEQTASLDSFAYVSAQKASIVHSPIQSFNTPAQFDQPITVEPEQKQRAEVNLSSVEPFSNVTARTETVVIESVWPTAAKAKIVHSPIESFQSAAEFEHPAAVVAEQKDQLQKANLVHSPIQDVKCATEIEQTHSVHSELMGHVQNIADVSCVTHKIERADFSRAKEDHIVFEYGLDTEQKRPAVVHSPVEPQRVIVVRESDGRDVSELSQLLSTATEKSSSSNENSAEKLDVVHRAHQSKIAPGTRWSVTDPDNCSSSGSHYDSFEKTDSRPISSDVENLYTSYGGSSEYQTAHDASFIPGESTEYVTAASTLDHSGKTISSHESMKSFDSESSGHLASLDVSEASETLVPSTADFELPTDTQSRDFEFELDENEQRLASLEACSGVLLEELNEDHIDHISSNMKRSQEMIFQADAKPMQTVESIEVTETAAPIEIVQQRHSDADRSLTGLSFEETKLASSLEDGSAYSVSFSSTSNVDTIVENIQGDMASSIGSSLIGSYEMPPMLRDDISGASLIGSYDMPPIFRDDISGASLIGSYDMPPTFRDDISGTSFDDGHSGQFESLVMTSSFVRDDDLHSVNTQITTTSEVSSETSSTMAEGRRHKGHRRNDSTAFVKTLDLGKVGSDSEDISLEDEMIIHEVPDDRKSESGSDSDPYETEYARSFKQPQKHLRKRAKLEKAERPDKEIERKKSVPSIETIVEDAEIEIDYHEERPPSQNMQDYSNIPDITITDDPTKYIEDDDDFLNKEVGAVQTEPPKPIKQIVPKRSEKPAAVTGTSVQYAKESEIKISDELYEELVERQYQTKIAEQTRKAQCQDERLGGDSPTSDSFEMVDVEPPDISDEFVIIEEVAKEAHELMTEGKGVGIQHTKYEKKHDDDVEKIIVKSAPAATNEGSRILEGRHDMAFEFEDSPPNGNESDPNGIDSSRKWVEMQLAEQAQNLRYPYDLERGILEDIKEEDTDFEVGSSRISSFKESFSSTPDYEALLGRRYHPSSKEADTVSMSSLQEFESLEQAISLENRKYHQGSQESFSNGSFPRRYNMARSTQADEISLSSLKDFEGLENACIEAHLLEIKAKEEHALLLSRSDESNKSNGSNGNGKTITKVTEISDKDGNAVRKVTEITTTVVSKASPKKTIEERVVTGYQSQPIVTRTVEYRIKSKNDDIDDDLSSTNIMEVSTDSLELGPKHLKLSCQSKDTSHHDSSDSLEISKSADIMTSSIDSIEISKDKSSKSDADSIDQLIAGRDQGERRDSIDSIDLQYALLEQATKSGRGSTDGNTQYTVQSALTTSGNQIIESKLITSTTSIASSSGYGGGISKDISSDSLNLNPSEKELLLTSSESLENTNTSSTNATYHNETDSQMSSSVTSCESNTLIDTLNTRGDRYQDFDDELVDVARTAMITTTTTAYRTVTKSNDQQNLP